ncbi:MAG: hypothetical protein PUE64_08265 [Firmicutes bacterium]|nr:hypothetical protein [Bacillota bacterium]
MDNNEKWFLEALQGLLLKAQKQQDMVTSDQIDDTFAGLNLTDEQVQTIRDYLTTNHIGIDAPPEDEMALTEVDHDYLTDYEQMIAALDQPDPDVMDAVKLNAMAGQKDAQDQLAVYMLPKVADIAKLYRNQGVYMEDLIGTGNEALMRGVKLLGPLDKPEEVEPDLAQRIMDAMENLIAQNVEQKGAESEAAEQANKVKEKADELADALGRKVTPLELAAEGELTLDEIMEAVRNTGNKIDSIDYQE